MNKLLHKIVFIFIMLAISGQSLAQDEILISGHVMNIDNGNPVPDHPVMIFNRDLLINYAVFTDQDGYFEDTLLLQGIFIDTLFILTIDCIQEPHIQIFSNPTGQIYAFFEICVENYPPFCEAYFTYWPGIMDPLEVEFIDLSLGMIDDWYWDFGDGNYSIEQNPVHIYNEPGYYPVCLYISNQDSLFPCSDYFCEMVIVGDTSSCKASFDFTLDSLSAEPNVFQFFDRSTGNIDQWFWDFGDGSYAEEQNPEHQYLQEGTYDVCLTVVSSFNPVHCWDMTCKLVSTPTYTYFGGQVFAGNFPLNNPASTGDTGIACLYKVNHNELIAFDTNVFYNNAGLYAFNFLLEGEYVVKVGLSRNSEHYKDYFPTYYQGDLSWTAAGTVLLNDTIFDANVQLIPTTSVAYGPGNINGHVRFTEGSPISGPQQLNEVEVILFAEDDTPLIFVHTDVSGYYEFNDLPYGLYKLTAEETGYYGEVKTVILNQHNFFADSIDLVIHESPTFGIQEDDNGGFTVSHIYPNPASDEINLDIKLQDNICIKLLITDLTGRSCYSGKYCLSTGLNRLRIPVAELSKGVYIITMGSSSSPRKISRKFVK